MVKFGSAVLDSQRSAVRSRFIVDSCGAQGQARLALEKPRTSNARTASRGYGLKRRGTPRGCPKTRAGTRPAPTNEGATPWSFRGEGSARFLLKESRRVSDGSETVRYPSNRGSAGSRSQLQPPYRSGSSRLHARSNGTTDREWRSCPLSPIHRT